MSKYIFLTALLSFSSVATNTSIELSSENITLEYAKPVRLEQVLTDANKHSVQSYPSAYSLGSALYNLDKQRVANNKRQAVLNQIHNLKSSEPQLRQSLGILHDQIKTWQVSYRESLTLDLDVVRLDPSTNPLLEGQYVFTYSDKSNTIAMQGLFFSPREAKLTPNKTVRSYLENIPRLSSASDSFVWIIYPDGYYQQVGYAYWNDELTPLPSGSILFLGFNNPSDQLKQLEEDIVSLLAWRRNK